jgi:hypothetical protein
MTETSYLWDNPGTGDSPALGYGHTEFMEEMFRILWNGTGNRGVLRGWLNELLVTDGGGLNATVATGGAIVYGFAYESDVAATVVIGNNTTEWVVVRCSWAAQTARLAAIAPGGFTQTAGVTYDIPLAQVTTVAGAITLITDTREFCEYTTDLQDDVVEADHILADAVTTAKLENQTRWIFRGAGTLEPDVTNPAARYANTARVPYHDVWQFDATALESVWLTLRIPADYASGTATVYLWNMLEQSTGTADVLWGWNSWDAQASAVLVNQAGTLAIDQTGRLWDEMYRDILTTLTIAAGDIFHIEIYRNGAAGGDTEPHDSYLHMVEIVYTADS